MCFFILPCLWVEKQSLSLRTAGFWALPSKPRWKATQTGYPRVSRSPSASSLNAQDGSHLRPFQQRWQGWSEGSEFSNISPPLNPRVAAFWACLSLPPSLVPALTVEKRRAAVLPSDFPVCSVLPNAWIVLGGAPLTFPLCMLCFSQIIYDFL